MAKKKIRFAGSMVALVTPFRSGKVDRKAMAGLIDFHLKAGTDVIIPCGTTGESATMSHEDAGRREAQGRRGGRQAEGRLLGP
ncbi:MAG: 4-hydroxy-tetrahydrodipicolinate synthase [Candidatus Omnitrophica bacterium ADurb.Bin314]|nr:MAG: 4-hydroxy-tetrahydrodipicolinate synthase [Candidatus Omnitrophica bacterium ADurb.Bin314]